MTAVRAAQICELLLKGHTAKTLGLAEATVVAYKKRALIKLKKSMLILKVVITLLVVIGLSLIAERLSARWAGLLAGYPLGIAIVLCFLALEQGVEFAAQAAQYAVGGLGANVILALVYWQLAKTESANNGRIVSVLWASVTGILAFLLVSFTLHLLSLSFAVSILVTLLIIALVARYMSAVPKTKIQEKAKTSWVDLLFRGCLAALSVLLITGLAVLVGAEWAGLLAGFPVAAFPLFVILHYHYGNSLLTNSVKAYPLGLVSLLIYTISVSFTYPWLGVLWGTLAGFALSTLYLLMVQRAKHVT